MVGLHHGRAPGPAAEVHPIRSAAAVEAMAWGHREVDVDHLLLGLVVVAGPSALELAGAGADLAALRGAVARVRADGGADVAPRSVVRAADRRDAARMPVTGPARRLLDGAPRRRDDRALLLALLDDGNGLARRLLGHLDVDAAALRDRVADGSRVAGRAADGTAWPVPPPPGPAPTGTSWLHGTHAQLLPVPSERVWALLGDPSRRPEWDPDCVAVTVAPDGAELLTRPDGTVVSQTVHDTAVGRTLAWHRHEPGDPSAGPVRFLDVLRVVVAPDGARTAVGLRRDRSGRGVAWRLARPALSGLVRTQLRICLHAIHQAAA